MGPFRYVLAGLMVVGTIGAQMALESTPDPIVPLSASLLAVSIAAYFCGRGPALSVTVASLLANWYFLIPLRFNFVKANPAGWRQLIVFAAAGTFISFLSPWLTHKRNFPAMALSLTLSLCLVIAAVFAWLDFEQSRDTEAWVEHTYQVLNAAEELRSSIQNAEDSQRNFLLTGDQEDVTSYRAAVASETGIRRSLGDLTADNAIQQKRLSEIDRVVGLRLEILQRAMAIRTRQGLQAATIVVRSREGILAMQQIGSILEAIESEEHSLLNRRAKQAAAQATRARWALAMGPALLVAVLIVAGMIIESDLKKLRTSERILRRQADLLDKAPGPIIVWQLGGAIEYWNRGAEKLYGISREQAMGRDHNELLHPIHSLGMLGIQELLARDGEWCGELLHVIDGREVIVESHMTLVTEADGRKTVLKANRDITQEKRANAEIQQLNRELEQRVRDRTAQLEASNKELEAFAYSVSHDLRAPLRGIDGWSQALLEDCEPHLDRNGRQYLARVRDETQRMGRLIDDLLKLSRLTRVELQHEPVDLTALARNIACRLQESEPRRTVDFVIQEGLATGGDGRLLEIVLSNLLNNAVKFTGPRPVAKIEFGQTQFEAEPAYFVRDNGVGFDMAYATMLYGAFQRLHKHTEFPGNGIGLATVQRVLRRHGGRIWADAKPDEGATFYFTIGSESSG